ncbi:MAG: aryl-sulfate sulfotransferase [Eubacteriaceae bacterium]|jgi:arylsulfate sulfotransferase|nr:aryl-sulfate sulfotransferase [Eubacteriaceae bacterium]MDD4508565.1 aryl-sulfate sulfotransferase [Eubacteriaceae bacterium]
MNKNTKVMIGAGIVALILIIIVSFTLAYAGRDVTLLKDRTLHMAVNGFEMEIPLDQDGATYDVPCLTTERDNVFTLLEDAGANIKIEGTTLKTGRKAKVGVASISQNNTLSVSVTSSKDSRTIYLRTYSSLLPDKQASGQSAEDGCYYVTEKNKPVLYKLDKNGNVSYYIALSGNENKGKVFTDFRKHTLEDGSIRYSYNVTNPDVDTMGLSDYYPGMRIVLDENMEEISNKAGGITLHSKDETIEAKNPGDAVDGHGFIMLADDHYITEAYKNERVDNVPADLSVNEDGATVAANIIQEVNGDKVTWQWKSTDYPELYAMSATGNNYTSTDVQDYLHINAMMLDPSDKNLIVSFKNANMIVKISRTDGKIMWILGGKGDQFGLSDDQKFTAQSDVTLAEDGSLIISQNDKIVRITLDETNKKVKTYDTVVTGTGSSATLSASKIDKDKAIYGAAGDSGKIALCEKNNTDGKTTLKVVYPNGANIFRAYWFATTDNEK